MDLRSFIKESISQIIFGVRDVQEELERTGVKASVIPAHRGIRSDEASNQVVEFDVAVTTQSEQVGNAGGGLSVMGMSLGATGQRGSIDSSVSRIKFKVHVELPVQLPLEKPK